MTTSLNQRVTLSNQSSIPQLGFGTYKITELSEMSSAINMAIKAGYRSFDTAQLYKNEKILGQVLQNCELARDEIFVTSKIFNEKQGYESTLKAFEQSLHDLQMDYVDLFLVHWPLSNTFFDTWRALEKIYASGQAKAIGVCNFNISHLELLATKANIKPMINQIELHPYFTQKVLLQYLQQENIAVEAWAPLGSGEVLNNPTLIELGQQHNKSSAQIVLRWHVQSGHIAIPKSSNPDRIRENAKIFDFELSAAEMHIIDGLNKDLRTGKNPDDVYRNNGF